MAAFLSGLLGKMGQLQEQKEQRTYEEKKAERDRMRKLVEYAGETAIQKGDIEALPAILGELDELGEIPNAQSENPFADFGKRLGGLIHRSKQQQQQQTQAQKADQQYRAITGQPPPGVPVMVSPPMPPTQFAQPGAGAGAAAAAPAAAGALTPPPGAQPANVTPPMPALPGWVQRYRQAENLAQQRAQALKEQEFQTGRVHAGLEAGDVTERQKQRIGALAKFFQSPEGGGMDQKAAVEKAEQVVLPGFTPRPNVKEVLNVKGEPYGHPGEIGTLEVDLSSGKETFRPTGAKPGAERLITVNRGGHKLIYNYNTKEFTDLGPQDQPITWKPFQKDNQVWYVPYNTKTMAAVGPAQPAIPEGETAQGQTAPRGRIQTPPIPPPRKPVAAAAPAAGAPVAPPPGIPKGARYGGEKFSTADKQLMERAKTVMEAGVDANAQLAELQQEHPDWFGTWARLDYKGRALFASAHPELSNVLAKIHSVQNFLPSMHALRGKYPIESWEKVLLDPLVNPQATQSAIEGALAAVEDYRKNIQSGDFSTVISVEDLKKQRGGGGGGPTPEELEYMRKHGIQ